jgi:hypothetical protein
VSVRTLQVRFRHQRGDGQGVAIRQAKLRQGLMNERFQAAKFNSHFGLQDRYSGSKNAAALRTAMGEA